MGQNVPHQFSRDEKPLDLIVRGEVIDPASRLRGRRDVGIRDGVIVAVEPSLEGTPCRSLLDASGSYVCPGFIDIHAHIYAGVTSWGVRPDPPCLRSGVTTVVDAGSPGWPMLQGFRWYVHERAKVRALCFLHISGIGLVNAWVNECEDIRHLDPQTVGENVAENRDLVVGVKVRQGRLQVGENGTEPLRLAIEAAHIAGELPAEHAEGRGRRRKKEQDRQDGQDECERVTGLVRRPDRIEYEILTGPQCRVQAFPVMCHIAAGIPLGDVLELLRPGDIVTHCFQGRGAELENLTDPRGKLLPEVIDARQKGVVMDVGHGGGSFRWEVAEAALEQGFLPDVISTDLHAYNLHGPLFDMATTLTKFLYLGLPLDKVIECATVAPARAIRRTDLGTLAVGSPADLAIFSVVNEPVELWDTHLQPQTWDRRVQVEATVREGAVYRPEELEVETEEEITRRCRLRGPGALKHSWRAMLGQGAQTRAVR
jgi:dihydroorotase